MPARRRELKRTPGALLATNVGEIGQPIWHRQLVRLVEGLGLPLAAQVGGGLGEMVQRHRLDPGERGLGRRGCGAEQPRQPQLLRSFRRGQDARDRPDTSVQSELADRRVAAQAFLRHLPRGGQHGERDRQIKTRPLLAKLCRSEIDRQPPVRPVQLRGGDAAADALLRLLTGAVREPYDRERRQPVLQVRLDLDSTRVETDERVGDRPRKHPADASGEGVTCLSRVCAGSESADDHILEVLACASPRPSVHMAPVPALLAQARAFQDLRIQLAPVVDDDHHRGARPQ